MAGPKSHKGRRRKGAVAEREFFALLNKYLPERLRLSRDLAQSRDGGSDGSTAQMVIEVKRQETLRLNDWLRQARGSARLDQIPVVAYRQSNDHWHCLVDMDPVQLAAYMRWRHNLEDTEEHIIRSELAAQSLPSSL